MKSIQYIPMLIAACSILDFSKSSAYPYNEPGQSVSSSGNGFQSSSGMKIVGSGVSIIRTEVRPQSGQSVGPPASPKSAGDTGSNPSPSSSNSPSPSSPQDPSTSTTPSNVANAPDTPTTVTPNQTPTATATPSPPATAQNQSNSSRPAWLNPVLIVVGCLVALTAVGAGFAYRRVRLIREGRRDVQEAQVSVAQAVQNAVASA